jgi:hypothetical protein
LKFNITETEETSRELTLTNPSSDRYRLFSFWHVDHLLSVNVLKVPVEINASGEVRPDWHLSDQVQFTETNESVVTYAIVRRSRASGAMLETCGSAGKGAGVKEGVPSRMTES